MMNTAILMTAGVGQPGVLPVSSHLVAPNETVHISFAKSFKEGVEFSALLQGKSAAGENASALPDLKTLTVGKRSDEVSDVLHGANGRETVEHGDLKKVVGGKIAQSQVTAESESHEEATPVDSPMMKAEPSALVAGAANDASHGYDVSKVASSALPTETDHAPVISVKDGEGPAVTNSGKPAVLKETGNKGSGNESSSLISAKAQESRTTSKAQRKATGVAVDHKPVANPADGATSAIGLSAAPSVPPQSDLSKTAEVLGKAVSGATKVSVKDSAATTVGLVRKDSAPGTKAGDIHAESKTVADDQVVSPKPDLPLEKTTAAPSIAGGSDGESKAQGAPGPEPAAALVHAVSGGGGVLSAIASGVLAPGNAQRDSAVATLPAGDASVHASGLPNESRDLDGSGSAAAMDGMPRMLTATPTSLEVGIQNGTHGWLKVRAEMTDGGGVNASVSAASSAGQEMLHRELPALTAYLQGEKVAVNAVVVHTAPAAADSSNLAGAMSGEGGDQTQHKSSPREEQAPDARTTVSGRSDERMSYQGLNSVSEDGLLASAGYAAGGSWLSVRA